MPKKKVVPVVSEKRPKRKRVIKNRRCCVHTRALVHFSVEEEEVVIRRKHNRTIHLDALADELGGFCSGFLRPLLMQGNPEAHLLEQEALDDQIFSLCIGDGDRIAAIAEELGITVPRVKEGLKRFGIQGKN
jgi:hypothetical protein